MTLYETIDLLKKIALKHPNIGSASEGNIYEYMNANPSVKYGVFFITQGTHSQDEMFNHFDFTLFYVDRLVDDMEENRLQIQSIGKEILSNILTFFCEEFDAECENISFQPFTQRFVDETAGIYSTITIDVPKDVICPEEYWKEDWATPVTVIRNQDKRVVFTENGTYTIDYDPTIYTGLGNVEVNVNIDVDSYYNQGKTDGVNEQKSKLETINITENGTYTKEDGYSKVVVNVPDLNGDYNEGYNQGQADISAKARVLEVTKNGNYLSKFSDPIIPTTVTGVYADGTEFYSYAQLNGKVFNTNIPATPTTRLELWYKGDNTLAGDAWNIIIGAEKNPDYNCYQIRYNMYSNSDLIFELGRNNLRYTWDENAWHHILIAKETENASSMSLWVDEVKIGDFGNTPFNPQSPFYINCIESFTDLTRNANGYFGMIKIDDTIIIPTANGFKNVNTGELLEVVKNGAYTFTDNSIKYGEGELYKTINVNVIPKVNPQKEGLRLGYSTFTEVPEWVDFEGVTDMSNMFNSCNNLQTIPLINTSNVTNMSNMFSNCGNLQTISLIDTSNVTAMSNMFNGCISLKTIPLLDTSNVTNMSNMFSKCNNLQTIPLIDTSNVTNMSNMFSNCNNLQTIPLLNTSNVTNMSNMFYDFGGIKTLVSLPKFNCQKVTDMYRYFSYYEDGMSALTDVGGWENLKCNWNDRYGLASCPNLTYQSCINILNGLYDFVGNGESTTKTLKVHPNFLTTVGDEISIGTSRGWTITA